MSLHGQLLWREFFYTVGAGTPNFDKMEGNSVCTQVDWDDNEEFLQAWKMVRELSVFVNLYNQLNNRIIIRLCSKIIVAQLSLKLTHNQFTMEPVFSVHLVFSSIGKVLAQENSRWSLEHMPVGHADSSNSVL